MKKITAVILTAALSTAITANSFAAQQLILNYDGKNYNYEGKIYTLKVNGDIVNADVPPVVLGYSLLIPARAFFEKLGANVTWNASVQTLYVSLDNNKYEFKMNDNNIKVNGKTVTLDYPVKMINGRAFFDVSFINTQLGMQVELPGDGDTVTVEGKEQLKNDGKNYNYEGKIYTLKVNGDVVNADVAPVVLGYSLLIPARAFFEKLGANVTWNASVQTLYVSLDNNKYEFKMNDNNIKVNGKTVTLGYPVKMINGRAFFDVSFINTQLGMQVELPGDGDTVTVEGKEQLKNVQYSVKGDKDGVLLDLSSYKDYRVFRLTGSDRLVIDIPNTNAPDAVQKIDVNKGYIKSIRYFQWQGTTARVVLDLTGQPAYEVDERNGQLGLYISTPGYKNVEYVNEGDRVVLKLYGSKLTELTDGNLNRFYTESYDKSKNKYTLTFSSTLGDLGMGVMKINDEVLDSVEVINNVRTNQTSITFNAKDNYVYVPVYRPLVDNTAITLVKPAAKDERIVVVDAGHGGDAEPGAMVGDLKEKDLNLDIALRLNKLLKSKNVKTYMIRESDIYVWYFERAFIANAMNASLFICVHNNALDDTSYGGTMSLYYSSSDNGFNSKRYAQIVQSKLLSALGTKDRKIIERPDLVVLNKTNMPSVLAEIAFMTNKQDRNNLLKPDFRQRAANALSDSVVQALSELK